MSADVVTLAVLDYLNHGAYPESEEIASASLSSDVLSALLNELTKAQDTIKAEIRSRSAIAAPDIDSWISRAKEIQTDIAHSRDIAHEIVAEAEAGKKLKVAAEDAANKVELLEKEVAFNETITGVLEHVAYANGLLQRVQDYAIRGEVERALDILENAEASIAGLESMETSKAYDVLRMKGDQLKSNLIETATECWNAFVNVDQDEKTLSIRKAGLSADVPDAAVSEIGLDVIVKCVQGLGVFDGLIRKLGKDLERFIFRPRLRPDSDGFTVKVVVSGDQLSCSEKSNTLDIMSLLRDLRVMLEFIATRLPLSVTGPLSELIIPGLASRLDEHWLQPIIPVKLSDMAHFQTILNDVLQLADQIETLGWFGSNHFRDWVQNAPRLWLTKRREAVLGGVRNLAFTRLRETKVVERVETHLIGKPDTETAAGVGGHEDGPASERHKAEIQPTDVDDEDMSAWDVDEEDEGAGTKTEGEEDVSAWDVEDDPMEIEEPTEGKEDDAWGWGDEESSSRPTDRSGSKQQSTVNVNGDDEHEEREVTLRESFTVTAVPDGILEIIQQLISDAETLAGPEFELSSIAPVATALYTLPTLALAIYRATAPTAYSKLDTGNMFIYNDSSRLADQLRSWQADRPPSSRLRLDNDVKALESFAKRAYGSEMESQRTILRDLLDGAQGFSNCTVAPYKAECESAVEQTVHRLRDVYKMWKDVLSQSALLQSLGSLLATVTGKMISEIEDLGDIAEADSHQLKKLIEQMSSSTEMFIQSQPGGPPEGTDMTFVYCPNWLKFLYLAEILESSLADIKYMWQEGELSLEFDADEVVELIEALFAESELRRQAVRDVRRGVRG